jgi:type III restriction enzyme
MKIKFDPDLDFQHEAISSITGIFEGQEVCQTNFSVAPLNYDPKMNLGLEKHYDLGIGNRLKLLMRIY